MRRKNTRDSLPAKLVKRSGKRRIFSLILYNKEGWLIKRVRSWWEESPLLPDGGARKWHQEPTRVQMQAAITLLAFG
ncbi:uncharacterized protein G2W53_003922 [Senna tora]|uniref:Uncharacterized protein n=1 Tax=Senna tora TaxID=362788 RepID=A0A834XCB0_9FABA|nr:uncharacterized protein G2W53_003922 [Senna tora]